MECFELWIESYDQHVLDFIPFRKYVRCRFCRPFEESLLRDEIKLQSGGIIYDTALAHRIALQGIFYLKRKPSGSL